MPSTLSSVVSAKIELEDQHPTGDTDTYRDSLKLSFEHPCPGV